MKKILYLIGITSLMILQHQSASIAADDMDTIQQDDTQAEGSASEDGAAEESAPAESDDSATEESTPAESESSATEESTPAESESSATEESTPAESNDGTATHNNNANPAIPNQKPSLLKRFQHHVASGARNASRSLDLGNTIGSAAKQNLENTLQNPGETLGHVTGALNYLHNKRQESRNLQNARQQRQQNARQQRQQNARQQHQQNARQQHQQNARQQHQQNARQQHQQNARQQHQQNARQQRQQNARQQHTSRGHIPTPPPMPIMNQRADQKKQAQSPLAAQLKAKREKLKSPQKR